MTSPAPGPFRLLLALALPVYFLCLGANSIWDANEAFYVETPRQMVLTGDYLRPSFNALERFNKPVLSYWIVAGLYQLFGISVAVERFGIALGAMGLVFATFLIGRAIRGTLTGVLAALFVATAPRVVFFSRRIFIDVYITLFMALTLACFVLAERHPQHRRRYLLLMYVAIGLGILTKGPVALVLPAAACGLWLLVQRRLGDLRRMMLIPGALIVLAIVAPWYIAVGLYETHGWHHAREFFLGENLGRFASSMTTDRSPLFFLMVLFGDLLLPWAPLLIVVMVAEWRRWRQPTPAPFDDLRLLLWLWIAVIVGAFSFSASKEDLYIFSVVPAVAGLIADAFAGRGFGATDRVLRAGLLVIAAGYVGCALFVQQFLSAGYYRIAWAPVVVGVLAGGGIAAMTAILRRRERLGVVLLAGSLIGLNYIFVVRVLPDLERLKPVPKIADVIRSSEDPDAHVGFCNMDLPSVVYYVDRPVTALDGVPHAVDFFKQYDDAWVLMGEDEWAALQPRIPGLCVRDTQPLFETRVEDIIRGTPPPDIFVVSRCK
jgi:4-amino-4-deoxy-L-arabinose transferase-like glycosyltransferase